MNSTPRALRSVFVEGNYPISYDYIASQMPFVGKIRSMKDNARYWEDYARNTGYTARYPGRTYSNGGVGQSVAEGTAFMENVKKIYG